MFSKGAWWFVSAELEVVLGWVLVLSEKAGDGVPALIDRVVSVDRVKDSADF